MAIFRSRFVAVCTLSFGMACADGRPNPLAPDADAAAQPMAPTLSQSGQDAAAHDAAETVVGHSAEGSVMETARMDGQAPYDAQSPTPDAAPPRSQAAVVESVTLTWRGVPLAATLYLPERDGPVPAVVTAPGFGGVKEMLIPAFAASAAAAGVATLAIDYAGFGGSGGTPRQHVDPPAQVDQMRTGLDSLAMHPAVDPTRLGVWGTSLSGGHALALASADARIRCVVAIIPFVGASETAISAELLALVAADTAAQAAGLPGGTVPAVGRPGDIAVMTTDGAWEWSEAITKDAPSWKNEVTLGSLLGMGSYTPADKASTIAVPVRAILATSDTITPAALARSALANVPQLDVIERPDTHFELFRDRLDDTIALTTEWLAKHLKAAAARSKP